LFQKSVKSVSNEVLDFRLKQIKTLNSASQKLTIPTTYIQAKDDSSGEALYEKYSTKIAKWSKE